MVVSGEGRWRVSTMLDSLLAMNQDSHKAPLTQAIGYLDSEFQNLP